MTLFLEKVCVCVWGGGNVILVQCPSKGELHRNPKIEHVLYAI